MADTYLTYEYYQENGGSVSASDFTRLLRIARRYLDYFTRQRIDYTVELSEDVKDLLCRYVDILANTDEFNSLNSYSNGVESFSFNNNSTAQKSMYNLAVMYLPIELISTHISGGGRQCRC